MKKLTLLIFALALLNGCAAYKSAKWTPDTINYTVRVDHQTHDIVSYFGASWSLK